MTSVLIIFEMTRGYGLVLPLMIANMSAFALARHWRRTPVYDALLEQDGIYLHGAPESMESEMEANAAEPPLFQELKDKGTYVE
jgi:CIC family chloride channel protein